MSTDSYSSTTRRKHLQTGEWAETEGLFHELLPYGYRESNPLEILTALRETYESLGNYKQLWQSSHVVDETGLSVSPRQYRRLILFSGAWPVYTHREGNPHSYANPLYTHEKYPAINDTARRKELLAQTVDIPHWTDSRLGQAFGITKHGARKYRLRHGDSIDGHYNQLDRLARTVKTINHWGYTYKEIGEALPYKWKTLHKQVENLAQDYTPPSNPYK